MAELPSGLISHTKKVCSLYKRALRTLESFNYRRHEYRYEAVLLRQRFEKNRHIPDARIAKKLLLEGEEELFKKCHWDPYKFPDSPGGIVHGRFVEPPDAVLDFWDPIEKAQYPKYFGQREKLKVEYEKLYKKLYLDNKETSKSNK
ncbi:NADH dehydrogenase [ubiquinone] 1 beta subcomplex subunit 9 [Apis dorsata]|uniref:NADH dehydrogenase [ubiquinone] 1 beta subcomplex subunit 9 n=1 Tax=Apis dorsata TaxID=7462 RepID=UPI0003DF60FA|nr:NADH dehydrogenase [ubiquinone] 1 beta subcomplex subunit 9 [Apis dorsata]